MIEPYQRRDLIIPALSGFACAVNMPPSAMAGRRQCMSNGFGLKTVAPSLKHGYQLPATRAIMLWRHPREDLMNLKIITMAICLISTNAYADQNIKQTQIYKTLYQQCREEFHNRPSLGGPSPTSKTTCKNSWGGGFECETIQPTNGHDRAAIELCPGIVLKQIEELKQMQDR